MSNTKKQKTTAKEVNNFEDQASLDPDNQTTTSDQQASQKDDASASDPAASDPEQLESAADAVLQDNLAEQSTTKAARNEDEPLVENLRF